jgi:hypothetical protein
MSALEPLTENPARRPWLAALREPASLLSAAKWGAIMAVGYYIISLLVVFVELALTKGGADPSQNLAFAVPLCVGIFAIVFALYAAGYQAGSERMHAAPGAAAAVVMVIISYILGFIYTPGTTAAPTHSTSHVPAAYGPLIGAEIVAFILYVMAVIGLGYLGGFYGVKNKLKAQAKAKA